MGITTSLSSKLYSARGSWMRTLVSMTKCLGTQPYYNARARYHARRMSPLLLAGLRVLVTRPLEHSAGWMRAFAAAGAVAIPYPTVDVVPPSSWQPLDEALARLGEY